MNYPLVTIVVPIYNVEKYLDRCIESIVCQTYSNLEIILVDDGSTDNCPGMCDEWGKKDSRIKVVHKLNEGLGMARNTGIENATGDYICFFDSDDYVEVDTVETCVMAALEHKVDLVVFGHDVVTPEKFSINIYLPHPPKQLFCDKEISSILLPVALSHYQKTGEDWNLTLSAWSKLYSLKVIRETGWRFVSEREIISEDYYSLTELFGYLKSVYVVNKVFYHYTVNNTSLSRSYNAERFEKIKFFYKAMLLLSEKMCARDILEQSINGVTFGITVGAMKIIVSSNISLKQKYSELSKLVKDDFLHNLICATDYSGAGLQKKLLYKAIKYKLVLLCFLLVYLKNKCNT